MAIPAVLVVALGIGIPAALQGKSPPFQLPSSVFFPSYVLAASRDVQEAYAYAVEAPQVLRYIPCFCGCGQHSGHTAIHDCFVQQQHATGGPVAFDEHGVGCQMCVDIAREAKLRIQRGETLQQIRQYVVARYSQVGPSTNTPPIP
ncbi:MAG: hypothetical protein HY683_00505 [Chloroflexi bacterium]|nr:hypothetical protein [Chloroflexota bacterium]